MASSGDIPPSLEADFVVLRKLRDDDESCAIKELVGNGEDPREWKERSGAKAVTVSYGQDGRVTKLDLFRCFVRTELTALPATIGNTPHEG